MCHYFKFSYSYYDSIGIMLETDKKILNYNDIKISIIHNSVCLVLSRFCIIVGLVSLLTIEFNLAGQEHNFIKNIIRNAWADDINGTENADNITGTINQDTIRGIGGNDTLAGKEAGDDISGGSGDDIIYGNEGRDALRGKAGNDHIEGGEGNDRVYGDRGSDILIGGPGNDTLTGGPGKDIFICGTAADTITDFHIDQEDTIPENDCESIKYGDNTKTQSSSSSLQEQQDSPSGNTDMEEITANTTQKIEEQKPENGFFFGLFK